MFKWDAYLNSVVVLKLYYVKRFIDDMIIAKYDTISENNIIIRIVFFDNYGEVNKK